MNKKEQQIFDKFQSLKAIQPGAGWMAFNKERLLQKIELSEENKVKNANPSKRSFGFNFKLATACFSAVLMVLGTCGMMVGAKSSLPGDVLYPVKILMEDARIVFSSKKNKSILEMEYAERRLGELCQLTSIKENVSEEKIVEVVANFQLYMASLNRRMEDAQVNNETEKIAYTAKSINEKTEEFEKQIKEASKDVTDDIKSNIDEALVAAENTNTESFNIMASISATSSVFSIPDEEWLYRIDPKLNDIDNKFTDLDESQYESEAYKEIKDCLKLAEEYFNEKDFPKTWEIIEECEIKFGELEAVEEQVEEEIEE